MQIIAFGIFPTTTKTIVYTVSIYDDSAVYAASSQQFTPETMSSS